MSYVSYFLMHISSGNEHINSGDAFLLALRERHSEQEISVALKTSEKAQSDTGRSSDLHLN